MRVLVLIEASGTFLADFALVLEMIDGLISGASDRSHELLKKNHASTVGRWATICRSRGSDKIPGP